MELPGNQWALNIGLVNQTTLVAIGATTGMKMQRGSYNGKPGGYSTTHNRNQNAAGQGFTSKIPTNRTGTVKLHAASWDPLTSNLFLLPVPLFESLYCRIALTPVGILGAIVGVPPLFLFPAVLITDSNWAPDSEQGQPVDFEFESVVPYSTPGETAVAFTF